jgi:hypothetical protein
MNELTFGDYHSNSDFFGLLYGQVHTIEPDHCPQPIIPIHPRRGGSLLNNTRGGFAVAKSTLDVSHIHVYEDPIIYAATAV